MASTGSATQLSTRSGDRCECARKQGFGAFDATRDSFDCFCAHCNIHRYLLLRAVSASAMAALAHSQSGAVPITLMDIPSLVVLLTPAIIFLNDAA